MDFHEFHSLQLQTPSETVFGVVFLGVCLHLLRVFGAPGIIIPLHGHFIATSHQHRLQLIFRRAQRVLRQGSAAEALLGSPEDERLAGVGEDRKIRRNIHGDNRGLIINIHGGRFRPFRTIQSHGSNHILTKYAVGLEINNLTKMLG